jgi:predicted Zn-dependent peptidase
MQLLGTNIGGGIGGEQGSIGFVSTTKNFAATLDILQDLILNPTFPAEALERLRGRVLVNLTQQKDQPETIGANVFAKVLYGSQHPYGTRPTEASVKAITRDDVVAFHKAYYQPGRAIVTVVGDITSAAATKTIELELKGWARGGSKPSFAYPKPLDRGPATIYLVDKPGAAQSVVNIGLPGPPRNTPDYFALQVLNYILGGHFQSRLNANLREQHAYSYGANSSFAYGKGPGPFRAGAAVVPGKTDAALVEFMKGFADCCERPITDEEFKMAKDALIQGRQETWLGLADGSTITGLAVQDLPDNYYQNYAKNVAAVTREDLARVARQYIDLGHLAIVIVGDRASVEAPLKATGLAPITILDAEGNPSTATSKPGE